MALEQSHNQDYVTLLNTLRRYQRYTMMKTLSLTGDVWVKLKFQTKVQFILINLELCQVNTKY